MAQISKIKLPNNIVYDITDIGAIHSTDKGVANGVAPLNASRLIDSTYLPSYVDDVIEGYYYNNKFWKEAAHTTEIVGEAGKIYIDLTTNPANTYRYTGSSFVLIGSGGGSVITITRDLTSGTKSATINVNGTDYDLYSTNDTTYESKSASSGGSDVSLVTTGEKYNWNNKVSKSPTTASLTVVGWSNKSQTINVSNVTSSNDIVVSPAVGSIDDYSSAGIKCTAQGSGTLTFTCESVPSAAISVNVLILN